MVEGDVKSELVRIDYPVIRILEIDPHTGEQTRETVLPFRPGPFEWGPGKPRSPGFLGRALSLVSFGLLGPSGSSEEVLTQPGDPFQFVVKEHLPASHAGGGARGRCRRLADDPARSPDSRGRACPRRRMPSDRKKQHWFATERKFYRVVRSQPPALLAFWLCRPARAGRRFPQAPGSSPATKGVARFRYSDRSGKARVFDWALDGQQGKSVVLPESELTVTLSQATEFPTQGSAARSSPGRRPDSDRRVQDPAGKGEPITHMALANLPMVPNVIPPPDDSGESPAATTGRDSLHGHADDRPQDQRPVRPDRSPGRPGPMRSITASSAGARRARASCAPPGRWPRASRSSPSAATPTCR